MFGQNVRSHAPLTDDEIAHIIAGALFLFIKDNNSNSEGS
mgnify:CR=1 FL=1